MSDTPETQAEEIEPANPPEWAVVEIMGHRQHAGLCQEVQRFGAVMLRIDVPGENSTFKATHFYGGSAIFSYRACTEAIARRYNGLIEPRPAVTYDPVSPGAPVNDVDDLLDGEDGHW